MELERLTEEIKAKILHGVKVPEFHPGEVSLWVRFVRFRPLDGAYVEENVAHPCKHDFHANTVEEVAAAAAEQIALAVYGAEAPVLHAMPNLVVRLFAHKAIIPWPGAAPLTEPGQIWLKATANTCDRSLWDQLFGHRKPHGD